jgi:hypothetical protein
MGVCVVLSFEEFLKHLLASALLAVVRIQDFEPRHRRRLIRPESVLRYDAFKIAGTDGLE